MSPPPSTAQPQDIASGTTGAQLAAAIQAAYNATPVVACDAPDRLLRFVVLCFNPASGAIQDCPWSTDVGCAGPLRVPRTGRVSAGQQTGMGWQLVGSHVL